MNISRQQLKGYMPEGWLFDFDDRGKPYYFKKGKPVTATYVYPNDEESTQDKSLNFQNIVDEKFVKGAERPEGSSHDDCEEDDAQADAPSTYSWNCWDRSGYWKMLMTALQIKK